MTEFIIRDYSNAGEDREPTIRVVDVEELLELLDRVREDKSVKISVHRIGDCLLDWS